jgi:hypothetical protein
MKQNNKKLFEGLLPFIPDFNLEHSGVTMPMLAIRLSENSSPCENPGTKKSKIAKKGKKTAKNAEKTQENEEKTTDFWLYSKQKKICQQIQLNTEVLSTITVHQRLTSLLISVSQNIITATGPRMVVF